LQVFRFFAGPRSNFLGNPQEDLMAKVNVRDVRERLGAALRRAKTA